jgi:hypothetical protein
MNLPSDYALRKAQLVAQCDLERLRLRFALGQIRDTLTAPVAAPQPTVWAVPVAATLLSLALPSLGMRRVKGVVQMLSLALNSYRVLIRLRVLSAGAAPAGQASRASKT